MDEQPDRAALAASAWRGGTSWRRRAAPMRSFLTTETSSAKLLVVAVVGALVWANVDVDAYEGVWTTALSLRLGSMEVGRDLRTWVNSGLMTLFFLVIGLESRREFDLGDLRERKRFVLPLATGLMAMVIPVLIYLAFNSGRESVHGWGIAMSTDTALALGVLTLAARDFTDRARLFLVTVFVVDDLAALVVIAVVYSDNVQLVPLVVAGLVLGLLIAIARMPFARPGVLVCLGMVVWTALLFAAVDPIAAGLAIALSVPAYMPRRRELEEATLTVRRFREQPTPAFARSAVTNLNQSLSMNARAQAFWHPWSSYVVVPLFALANAGIVLSPDFLARAYTSPITLGVLVGYVVGKPIAVVGTAWTITVLSRGRVRPPVGWAAVVGGGTISGVGFTVALLIASRAFEGPYLAEAKLGALSAAVVASALTWLVLRLTRLLPRDQRARAILGDVKLLQDLVPEVDRDRDHIRGHATAGVTVIEFGDYECPYCGMAEPVVRELLQDADLRYVWRHLPLPDVHPHAQLAAEAAEAAASQGEFWRMHDMMLQHQQALEWDDLIQYATNVGLDVAQFHQDLIESVHQVRIAQDVESADLSGVSGTPTFFINGQRHHGAFDVETLSTAIKVARAKAQLQGQENPRGA